MKSYSRTDPREIRRQYHRTLARRENLAAWIILLLVLFIAFTLKFCL